MLRGVERIHFTGVGLAWACVATAIGVVAETLHSVRLLKDRDVSPMFRRWRVAVRGRLGEQAGPLAALMPVRGPLVDATCLMGDAAFIDEVVGNLMAAPPASWCVSNWRSSASVPPTVCGSGT
jgi:hypothetical protein